MKKIIIFGFLCILLFGSCVAPLTHIPIFAIWTKITERKIIYEEQINVDIPEYIQISSGLHSQNYILKFASFTKAYSYTVPPVNLWIKIDLLDRKITEIEILECKISANSKEYDIFTTSAKDIHSSEYKSSFINNTSSFSAGKYNGNFFSERKFMVNNTPEEYFDGFSVSFEKLPFDCNKDDEISIAYKFIIRDSNGQKEYNINTFYKRKLQEKTGVDENGEIWKEISYEEWEKYL